MSKFPKVGMKYQQAIEKGVRHAKEGSSHIVRSIANQVEMHEGTKAANEAFKEMASKGIEKRNKGRKYF